MERESLGLFSSASCMLFLKVWASVLNVHGSVCWVVSGYDNYVV